jgi:hypothetical protein
VVDHGDLEQRAVGQGCLRDLPDEGDVGDHIRGDSPTDVADDHRVAETEAEEVRGVHARIEARDDDQSQVREDDRALVAIGGGEGAVALERGIDVRHGHRGAPLPLACVMQGSLRARRDFCQASQLRFPLCCSATIQIRSARSRGRLKSSASAGRS